MVKARVLTIGVSGDGSAYIVQVDFPEFPAPGGTTQTLVFETTEEEYKAWTPPDGVTKNPKTFLEYNFIRPAYENLKKIHETFKPLVDTKFDW